MPTRGCASTATWAGCTRSSLEDLGTAKRPRASSSRPADGSSRRARTASCSSSSSRCGSAPRAPARLRQPSLRLVRLRALRPPRRRGASQPPRARAGACGLASKVERRSTTDKDKDSRKSRFFTLRRRRNRRPTKSWRSRRFRCRPRRHAGGMICAWRTLRRMRAKRPTRLSRRRSSSRGATTRDSRRGPPRGATMTSRAAKEEPPLLLLVVLVELLNTMHQPQRKDRRRTCGPGARAAAMASTRRLSTTDPASLQRKRNKLRRRRRRRKREVLSGRASGRSSAMSISRAALAKMPTPSCRRACRALRALLISADREEQKQQWRRR
mmetsp:Transcript_2516/g.9212  ORF Transcript_2516/g.9212 Transcript_2516/m.9212 type:complete len:326 (+) Transcript_2516:1008-1985(+)